VLEALRKDRFCAGCLKTAFLGERAQVDKFESLGYRECHT
jgi:hypothetical protein